MKFYNPKGEFIGFIENILKPKLEYEIKVPPIFKFSVPAPAQWEIPLESLVKTEYGDFIVKEKSSSADEYDLVCKPDFGTLQANVVSKVYATMTAKAMLDDLLSGLGWTAISSGTIKRSVSLMEKTQYEGIEAIAKEFKYEVAFDILAKTVTLEPKIGRLISGVYFHDEFNLHEVGVTSDSYDLVTRIIPRGANGISIESVNGGIPYVENFTYTNKIKTVVWEDNRYTISASLMSDAIEMLNDLSKPRKSYEVKVTNVAVNPAYGFLWYGIGDTIDLVSVRQGIDEIQRIVKISRDLENPEDDVLTIANTSRNYNVDLEDEIEFVKKDMTTIRVKFEILEDGITSTVTSIVEEQLDTVIPSLPIYTWIRYADDELGNGISDSPTGKKYMGIATNKPTQTESNVKTDYTWSKIEGPQGNQGLQGLQGVEGDQGIAGPPGADGVSSFTHIAYANSADGATDFSLSDSSRDYIGMYVDKNPIDSDNPAVYKWTLIKGADGSQGIQGPTGENGLTSYLHIAYATNATGSAGFSTKDSIGKTYIGQYTDFTLDDSTSPGDYSWTLIKGEKGDQGNQGLQGIQGPAGPPVYTWVKYADNASGGGMADLPTGKLYIGLAYNKTTPTESSTATDYAWSLIKGDQGNHGIQGPAGANGQSLYTWIKYADTPTTGMVDVPTGKKYLGIAYNKTTSAESANYGDYSWSLIEGPQGNQGNQGIQGPAGPANYTWVKYADTPTTGMSDLPDGKKYIGFAYNKTTATESSTYGDYTWSLIQGPQGVIGPNGTTFYTWLKYADTPTTGMADIPNGKKYMGIAYNKTTATESSVYADYSWSLIKGQSAVSISEQYYRSTSNSTQTGGSWLDTAPAFLAGTYIWTRLKTVWENPTATTTSTPVLSSTWDKLNNLNSRTTVNETAINQNATDITLKVSQSIYDAKMGTFNGKVSEIKQTADNVTLAFSKQQIGGTNVFGRQSFLGYYVGTGSIISSFKDDTPHGITVLGTNANGNFGILRIGGVIDSVGPWTVSFTAKTNNANGQMTVDICDSTPQVINLTQTKKYFTYTADVPVVNEIFNFVDFSNLEYAYVYIDDIKIEKGNTATAWSPHPEELYTGILKADRNGVNVGRSTSETNTQMSYDGLRVYDGLTERAYFGESGSFVPDLQVNSIVGNNIINATDGIIIYVGVGYAHATLTSALASINANGQKVKYIKDGGSVALVLNGQITDDVNIIGWMGGLINIYFLAGSRLIGRIFSEDCTSRILIHGEGGAFGTIKKNGSTNLVTASNCSYVRVYALNFDNNGTAGVYSTLFDEGSTGLVHDCDFGNCQVGIFAKASSRVSAINNRGNCEYAYYLADSIIANRGTSPNGSAVPVYSEGWYLENGTITLTGSAYSPPAQSEQPFTASFAPTALSTYTLAGEWSTYYGSTAAQNRWDTSSPMTKGKIKFGADLYKYIADRKAGTTPTVKIRLRRKNSTHGTSSAVTPTPFNFTPTAGFTGATRGGWSGWATIPYTLIGSGGYEFQFMTQPSGSTGNSYAIWDYAEISVSKVKIV